MVISQVGFDLNTAPGAVGAEAITDAIVTNTPIFIRTSTASSSSSPRSLVLNNIRLTNVPIAVGVNGGDIVLEGGTTTIGTWGQGNVYSSTSGRPLRSPREALLLSTRLRVYWPVQAIYSDEVIRNMRRTLLASSSVR